MNTTEIKRVLEAALLCTPQALSMVELRRLFDNEFNAELLTSLLDEIGNDWRGKPVELMAVASGWRFQSRSEYAMFINRLNPEKVPKYSRAVMETLAIVAYRSPVTRGDIEEIRGVSVSSQIIKALEERGWIEVLGHKEVPGRPALFGTTRQFLDDLSLRSTKELPSIEGMGEEDTAQLFNQQVGAIDIAKGSRPMPELVDDGADQESAPQEATETVETVGLLNSPELADPIQTDEPAAIVEPAELPGMADTSNWPRHGEAVELAAQPIALESEPPLAQTESTGPAEPGDQSPAGEEAEITGLAEPVEPLAAGEEAEIADLERPAGEVVPGANETPPPLVPEAKITEEQALAQALSAISLPNVDMTDDESSPDNTAEPDETTEPLESR